MEPYKEEYTFSRFEEICQKYPGNTALYYLGEKFSYSRLSMLINRFAAGLNNVAISASHVVFAFYYFFAVRETFNLCLADRLTEIFAYLFRKLRIA